MSYLNVVVQNRDKQHVPQIKCVNVACNLLALLKSGNSHLLAANTLKSFPVNFAFWGIISFRDRTHIFLLLCSSYIRHLLRKQICLSLHITVMFVQN
jgi:hypothetical protein